MLSTAQDLSLPATLGEIILVTDSCDISLCLPTLSSLDKIWPSLCDQHTQQSTLLAGLHITAKMLQQRLLFLVLAATDLTPLQIRGEFC